MGNAVSETSPLYTADELKWKSGAVADSIPSLGIGKVTTYENLHASAVFKDYLIKHIDSDYLISSIMSSSDDDAILLKGIEKFKNLEPEWIDSLHKLVENFELCTSAGINVKENDPLTMCEKQLAAGFRSSHAPFLTAFQRRLACMRIMQICIELERKDALATFPTKKSSEPEPSPSNQAQLMVLHGLKNAGVSLITMFPMCYRALADPSQRQLLAQPVKLFCEHMCNMADLELLLPCTQSATEPADPRVLDLRSAAVVSASSGPHSCVHDSNQDTYWTGTHLTVTFNAPHDVTSVTLAWVPKYKAHLIDPTAPTEVYAPRRVALFARTVDEEGKEKPKVKVFCVLPSVERSKQGSWVQTYKVDMQRVKTLKFTLSIKGCDENAADVSKLYHLDVTLSDDSACSKIRTLPLLKEVQRALVPLAEFSDVTKAAYDAQIAIVRSSGSLSLLLALVNSVYTSSAESIVQQKSAHAILKLLQAINTSHYSICSMYNKIYVMEGSAVPNVKFTSTTADVSPSGTTVTCTSKIGAAILSTELASGVYEWTLTLDQEVSGDESVFLGVVGESCRAQSPEAILRSNDAYFVRCYNGEIFQGKRCCALPVSAVHPGDACRFVYHSERRTVSLWVNGAPQGVVFDQLGANMRPCVLFQPSAHTRAVSVSNTSLISTILTNGASDKLKLAVREAPTLPAVQSTHSILALVLLEVQHLAQAKAQELQSTLNGALAHAYCAECTVETILLLIALVKRLKTDLDTTTTSTSSDSSAHITSMIQSLLVVLDLQFQCIKLSKIDLRDLGFHNTITTNTTVTTTSTSTNTTSTLDFELLSTTYSDSGRFTPHTLTNTHMAAASLVLQDLMSCTHTPLSEAAVTAFSHGLSFFLPSTERKMALITDIVAQMDVSQGISRIASEPRLKLLQLLIQRFRETSEILAFIDCVARNSDQGVVLSDLVRVLLELLVTLQSDAACAENTAVNVNVDGESESDGAGGFGAAQQAALAADISALLSTYQQQLVYEVLAPTPLAITTSVSGAALALRQSALCTILLLPYVQALLVSSRKFVLATLGADIAQESLRDAVLRESVVGALVQPLLYSLCLPGFELSFYQEICPELVKTLELLTQYSSASAACGAANSLILSTIPRTSGTTTSQSGLGWRTIKACFEDSEGTFTTSDNSTLYTSVTTSNTAAIVTTKFTSKQKAAWEFLLEADSSGDECSTFGAARGPPTSRCYSSSPDLWMRRAYNGYLYALGASTGQVMDKVKPGDTVRVEFDGKAGTISFGLNGSDPEVAFTGITDDVYPACGSYRNGVSIRLTKVEVFDTLDDAGEDEISAVSAFARPSADIKWVLHEDNFMSTRDHCLLSPAVPKGSKHKAPTVRWVTARADKGALYGVHDYTFELMHMSKSPYSVGVVCGTPYPSDRLAGPCLKISSKSSKTSDIPGSSLRLSVASDVGPVSVTSQVATAVSPPAPVPSGSVDIPNVVRAASAGSSGASLAFSALAGLTPLRPPPSVTIMPGIILGALEPMPSPTAPPSPAHGRSTPPVAMFGESLPTDSSGSMRNNTSHLTSSSESEQTPPSPPIEQTPELPLSRTYRYPSNVLALAWHSDGSLWHNGVKVGDDYGVSVLPLSKSAAVTMRVDRTERTVSFTVNGVSLGVAFGPAGSGAKALVALPRVSPENMSMFPAEGRAVFPAGSVSSSAQALRIRATGFRGSTVLPLQLSIQRALTSVLGRVSALLIQGPVVTPTEASMIPWFASNLMIGGVEEPIAASPLHTLEKTADPEIMIRDIVSGFSEYCSLSAGPTKSDVDSVFAWLEKIEPEPDFLRKALERSETYRFPACEMPFIACLLKHSGLGSEVVEVLRRSRVSEEGSPVDLPAPSGEMKSMWQRVKQLRVYLRQQRQSLRAIGIAIQSQSAKSVVPAPADPVTPAAASASLPPRPPRSNRRARLVRQHASRDLDSGDSSSTEEEDEEGEENDEDDDPESLFFRRNAGHDEHDDREDGDALMEMLSAIQDSLRQTFPDGQLPSEPEAETRVPPSPVRNPYLTPPVRTEVPDETGGESLIYYTDHIHWIPQPASAVSQRSAEETCAVLALGIDYTNELIFVRLHERFGVVDTHKAFQTSRLILNESVGMTAAEVQSEVKVPQERRGCLRFDCSSIATRFFRGLTQTSPGAKSSLKFQFGGSDYSTVDLELPPIFNVIMELTNRGISLGAEADASTTTTAEVDVAAEQFAKLCNAIKERAEFLLTLTPAVKALDSTDYHSKTLLHTLTKRYSGNFRPEDLSRWRAQERWKRVVEFLHVKSRTHHDSAAILPTGEHASNWEAFRAARDPSTTAMIKLPPALSRMGSSVLSEQDIQEAEDSGSPVLASMQACAIFMISDGIQATPADLKKIVETRSKRSESRVFGFNILIAVLDNVSDPLAISELLVFVRSALKITLPANVLNSDKTLLTMVSKHHYLNCLEGCSTRTLARVQDGFVDLYTVLSSLLRRCIVQWENAARSACVRSKDGPYSPSRSFRAMLLKNEEEPDEISECDPSSAHILLEPIQSLLELWTLHFSTRDHRWLNRIGIVPSLVKLTSSVFQEEVARTWRDTAERCIEFTKANAAHASASKHKWEMWSKDFVQQGLRNGTLTMRRVVHYLHNIPDSQLSLADRVEVGLTESFSQALDSWSDSHVVSMFHKVLKIVSRKKFIADSEKKQAEAEIEALEAERQQKILDRITPCGTFDPDNKARQVVLTGLNLEAHISDDGGGTAVCAYTTVKYDMAAGPELTGNYFEVTIVNLGRKAIGIGFADRATFRATGYMPGWEPHSYGYHGDDGHKFGSGSTPGDWPLFEVGDVIGCGFDFEARSIFYTRNGTLLGTGFTHISDTQLWPVVGFANRSRMREQVKINFGIQPFAYEADTITAHPLAVAERVRAAEADEVPAVEATAVNDEITSLSNTASAKSNAASVLEFSDSPADLVCVSQAEFVQRNREHKAQLTAAEAFSQELACLRQQSELVLRFLLTLACSSESDGSSGAALNDLPTTSSGAVGPSDALAPPIPVLTKEVSLFGTPKAFTSADGVCLQEGIVSHVVHEFLLSVSYLEAAVTSSRVSFGSLQRAQDFPGLDGSLSPGSGSPAGLLSAEEVSRAVHNHLVLFSSLYDGSKTIQETLHRPHLVNALLAITEMPYVGNRNAAFCLLSKILPTMQPETVEEALGSQWLESVTRFDALLRGSLYRKRMGKMPISLIQALSLTSCVALSSIPPALFTAPMPYGAGTRALELADLKLILVQRLFESPLWTELVACAVTDSLRNASSAVDKITSRSSDSAADTETVHEADSAVLQLACAACVTLNSLGICRTGTRVTVNGDATGLLLSHSEVAQTVSYVLERNQRALNLNTHVVTAPVSAIEPVVSVVAVDLAELSQPLLQQFFQLAEKVFKWFRLQKTAKIASSQEKLLHRLASLVSLTLSHLLANQSEVVNFVHDSSIIADLLSIALSPSDLPGLPSHKGVMDLWRNTQMRCLELPPVAPAVTTATADNPVSQEIGSLLSVSADKEALTETLSDALNIDETRRAERLRVAQELSVGLDAEERLCLLFLDFHMMNVADARESITRVKGNAALDPEVVAFFSGTAGSDVTPAATFDDANLLSKIGDYNPADLLFSTSFSTSKIAGENRHAQLSLLSTEEYVRRAVEEEEGTGEEVILLVRSDLDGRWPAVTGERQYTTAQDLLAAATEAARLRLHTSSKPKSADKSPECFLQTTYVDPSSGYEACDLFDPTNTHKVVSHIGSVPLSQLAAFRSQLDVNLTIQCARTVAAKLLLDGNLNIKQDLPREDRWVDLVKLVSSAGSENFEKVVPSLCTALTSHSGANAAAETGPNALVAEVTAGLRLLTNPQSLAAADRVEEDGAALVEFASPHPFPAPTNTTGVIRIPAHWRNVSLQFHPNCSTPSERAVLEFFASEEALAARKPLLSLSGPAENWTSAQNRSISGPLRSLYYQFSAAPASDRTSFPLVATDGSPAIFCNTCQVPHNDKVGLGEDDSLFNLFDTEPTPDDDGTATIECGVDFIPSGAWFYEATVTHDGATGEDQCLVGVISNEFSASDKTMKGSTHACAVHGDGLLTMQTALKYHDSDLGEWKAGDTIGCLFDLSESRISMWVGRNGVWSPQVTGEVTTAAWKPAVSIAGSFQMSLNWGESRFLFPPSAEIVEQLSCKAYQGVAFYTPQEEDAAVVAEREKLAWGYHFSVRPFVHLRMKLCSEFELVKKIAVEATSDAPAQSLWVWRPLVSAGFLAWGDIVTTSEYPPMRTVLLDANQCKAPVELELVMSSSKAEFAVLRPVAPAGHVALGDVVIGSTSPSSGQMSSALKKLVCVPEWAVKACEVSDFVAKFKDCGSGKELSTGSLWAVDNGLGGFFGSPFENRYSHESEGKTKSSSFKFFGVGAGYSLVSDTDLAARLSGEWTSEKEVLGAPSLQWTTSLLRSLLQSPSARPQVLTPGIFNQLVQFLRSSAACKPLAAVPLLIQMIRLAQKNKVKLPLDEIKSLCKSILTLAMTFTGSKSTKIPLSLLKLVDFVIEIQIAHIEDTYEKDNFNLFRRFVLHTDAKRRRSLTQLATEASSAAVESKEEDDPDGGIESKEQEPPLLTRQTSADSVALTQHASEEFMHSEALIAADLEELTRRVETTQLSGKWWDRVVVPPSLLRLHRGLKLSNIDNIFAKDSTILRLRQVLKFINAVVSSTGGASAFAPTLTSSSVSTAKDRPYPRFLSSKIWFDLASTSAVEESAHPYRSEPYVRKVHFPGADKLLVTFDRRCVLAKGDTLRVCSFTGLNSGRKNESVAFTHETADEIWAKGLSVQGDEVTFVLETSTSEGEAVVGNASNAWGWSCVVFATGSIYQRADTVLNVTDLPGVEAVDTNLEEIFVVEETTQDGEEGKEAEVSPLKAVVMGLSASVPAGSTGTDFASKTLEELRAATDSEVSCAAPAEITTAAEWAKQLVCLRGQLLHSGEVAVPMSHSLKVLFDHVPSTEESAQAATAKVLVVECTPSFASRAGQIKAAGPVFRVCLGNKFERALHTAVRGDTISYRVFGMTELNLLEILSAVPATTRSASPAAKEIAQADRDLFLTVFEAVTANTDDVQQPPAEVEAVAEVAEEEPVAYLEGMEEEADTSEQMWACEVCTLLNAPHLSECAVCSSLRPSSVASGAGGGATGEASAGAAAASLGWWCSVCTLINPISETTCNACGTARDTTAASGTAAESAEDGEEEEDAHSEHSSRSGTSASSEAEDLDEEENEEVDEVDSPAEVAEASTEPDTKRSRGADGKPRPVGDKDASLVSRMSGETKARVLSLKAGDDLVIITLEGKMTEVEEFEARLLGAMASRGTVQTPAQMMCGLSEWSHEADCELIDQMNAVQNISLPSHQFALPKKFLTYCSSMLAAKDLLEIQVRAQHIERFNKHLEHLLSFIDLGSDDPHSLGAMIRKCNRYLLLKIKTPLLESAITSTTVTSGKDCPASLVLDNAKSLQSRDREEKDPTTSHNCFVQAYQQLRAKDSVVFRCITSSDRVFMTTFVNESGIDAGGVYREAMSRIVEDLFCEHFDLLVLCPNAQQQVHSNMDKYVPNPQHAGSKLVREMFEFMGRLMALSVRTKLYLPFEFPPIIWKKIVGEEVGVEDFMSMDAIACKQVESVRAWDIEKVDPTKLRFAYQGSDKVERELVSGGKNKPVTFDNRVEFCEAITAARLNEFNEAAAGIARGMAEVIPSRALWLFSASQLETLVCGSPVFDLDLWKRKTDSTGVSAKTVELFWKVMETLTQKELAGFVRFAWGRSRLPAAKEFTTKMRLTHGGTAPLPVSHTCFFSVELPEYGTEEEMRHGLLTAIHYGVGGILNG